MSAGSRDKGSETRSTLSRFFDGGTMSGGVPSGSRRHRWGQRHVVHRWPPSRHPRWHGRGGKASESRCQGTGIRGEPIRAPIGCWRELPEFQTCNTVFRKFWRIPTTRQKLPPMDHVAETLAMLGPGDLFPAWCCIDLLEQLGELPGDEAVRWKCGVFGLMTSSLRLQP